MSNEEIEVALPFNNASLVQYSDNSIVIRTIMSKPTGYISVAAFAVGESLEGKISPFNTMLQIIEGEAEVVIGGESYIVGESHSIIIHANLRSTLIAKTPFKVLTTVIKSGYE
ncbi:hypothetical protein [Roseivirga pacifica]|uniref:hypothetical protein n=1 Tax=Roseivirga pacifica TaxID=1267423 RepID=UPI003BAA2532